MIGPMFLFLLYIPIDPKIETPDLQLLYSETVIVYLVQEHPLTGSQAKSDARVQAIRRECDSRDLRPVYVDNPPIRFNSPPMFYLPAPRDKEGLAALHGLASHPAVESVRALPRTFKFVPPATHP